MSITQRLDLRQSQTLVMTPQLQQAIKLLQLSNVELSDFVHQELERNPLLESADTVPTGDRPAEPADHAMDGSAEPIAQADRLGVDRITASETLAVGDAAPLDASFENVYSSAPASDFAGADGSAPAPSGGGDAEQMAYEGTYEGGLAGWQVSDRRFDGDEEPGIDQTLSEASSLRDHLLAQVPLAIRDPGDRLIATRLVDLVDEAGYLTPELDGLAEEMGVGPDRIERVVAQTQRFDPSGVFARDLKECLAIQLAERDRLDPAMAALLDNLPLLAKREFDKLVKLCGVDREDVLDMVTEIRALDPKPASRFDSSIIQTVVPDVLMRANPAGGWIVELNPETMPKVLVNQRYYQEISATLKSKDDKEYLAEAFQTASWLVKSLHQRATTIVKVASEIVRQQDGFFRRGVHELRPLILRNIAEAIDMHESTVSRVTSNKFMATPRGLYELKYFFTAAIQSTDGQATHSSEAVRHRIKLLIDKEEPKAVLSDDKLVEILKADGIDIARRTVAKYRESLKIPSSVQRRRQKLAATG